MVDSNQKSVVRQLKQMGLCLPLKRQQRRGGPHLCWQTVPRPRLCHRKGAVAKSYPTSRRHQQRSRVAGVDHLSVLGCWVHTRTNHNVCDAWPVQHQTGSYCIFPALCQFQRHTCMNNLPRVASKCVAAGIKVKVHTLDIAPHRSESPLQKHSVMAHVLKGFQFYLQTHTFIRHRNEPYLPLPFQLQLVLIYWPRRDGRLSRPWCKVAQAEIQTCNLPIANPALYHTATSTSSGSGWVTCLSKVQRPSHNDTKPYSGDKRTE